jgi:hypothetical protein
MVAPEMTAPCRERLTREHPECLGHETFTVWVTRASVLECGGPAPLWIPLPTPQKSAAELSAFPSARRPELLKHSSILRCSDCTARFKDKCRGRLSRSVWSARSLLPLLRGDAKHSMSKASASRTHSKSFAMKVCSFGSLASHFSRRDETELAHSKTFGQAYGPWRRS